MVDQPQRDAFSSSLDGLQETLILVGCVKEKRDRPAPAKDLYTSDLFKRRRTYAERTGCPWYILSAKHGLVAPDQLLAPYDQALKHVSRREREEWGRRVAPDVLAAIERHGVHTVELHAGMDYLPDSLREALESRGIEIVRPLARLRFGFQKQWYGTHNAGSNPPQVDPPAADQLQRFYELMDVLRDRLGGYRRLRECDGRMGWPSRGVYFFFDEREPCADGRPRAVRVGTHAVSRGSRTTLWNRLAQHRGIQQGTTLGGGNHRGSVFRRHVGAALICRGDFPAELLEL